MSGTVCCYSGCRKRYSTDKDVSFFKFPDDPKRRKKWMQNCGNLELQNLSDRQLRGKRICSDHFAQSCFLRPESRTALNDSAVPIVTKRKKLSATPEPPTSTSITESNRAACLTTPEKGLEGGKVLRKKMKTMDKTIHIPPPPSVKKVPIEVPIVTKRKKLSATPEPPTSTLIPESNRDACLTTPDKGLEGGKVLKKKPMDKTINIPPPTTSMPLLAKVKIEPQPITTPSPSVKKVSIEVPIVTKRKKPSATPEPPTSTSIPESNREACLTTPEKELEGGKVLRKKKKTMDKTKTIHIPPPPSVKKVSIEVPIVTKRKKLSATPEPPTSTSIPESNRDACLTTPEKGLEGGKVLKKKTMEKNIHIPPPPSVKNVSIEVPIVTKRKRLSATPEPPTSTSKPESNREACLTTPEKGLEGGKVLKKKKKTMDKTIHIPPPISIPLLAKVKIEPQPITTPPPSVKKVSIEAMMAAVASTKAPVAQICPPPAPIPTPILQLCMQQQPSRPQAPKPLPPSATTVEIVRQKPKDGNVTVVLVRQNETERVIKEHEVDGDNVSEADSYDEYMYYDREFDFEQEEDANKADREFERFHSSLKKFLRLPGKWTMGGVQWDPQGKRKVIIISEPEIPPSGRPCVKRCLQCFEDKSVRVFIDQMDMTDVFGMSCYAEKEDVAGLIIRVADASSCCGVPEMVVDDLSYFPRVRKRNTSYFDENCPGVIPNDAYDPICTACKELQGLLVESREKEKMRLLERRIRSEEKQFSHPFGQALYTLFSDLADETDPSKPKKKRTKETFFRKFLHDTRYKVTGDTSRTERVYIEKPISVDSVSQSFQDIVSKLGFNMPNAKKRPSGGLLPRPAPSTSGARPNNRLFPGTSGSGVKVERKLPVSMEHILPFTPGSSFTLDDGQEYELIGEVEPNPEFLEMKPNPSSAAPQQFEIIEVDDETLARLASSKNQVVMLPDTTGASMLPSSIPVTTTTRIGANDPNLTQILKAINTSHLTRF